MEIKQKLLEHVKQQVFKRHLKIKQTISDIEESLLEESKSTSGDKHETGRAMLQIDRENAGKQLLEIEKLISILPKIEIRTTSDYIRLGSLVYTEKFTYFISLCTGLTKLDDEEYVCISLNSPIGTQLIGKRTGDTFVFNNETFAILDIK